MLELPLNAACPSVTRCSVMSVLSESSINDGGGGALLLSASITALIIKLQMMFY